MSGPSGASTMVCQACENEVPESTFCGLCGAAQTGRLGRRRIRAYAAAPSEHTLVPSVATSLFPHLPRRALLPFRVGLVLLVVTMVVCALMRWQAPLITVCALGLPILFLIYLREAQIDRDVPRFSLVLTAVFGATLGVGSALVTGAVVAASYVVSLGPDYSGAQPVVDSLAVMAIPIGAAAVMLIPAAMIWLVPTGARELLDGFVFGALAAISFTAAVTFTLLAPQLETGVTADWTLPVSVLLVEGGIRGIAIPVTSAALGGLVGVTLWSGRRVLIAASVLVALGLFGVTGVVEVLTTISPYVHLGIHVVITLVALIAVRFGIQAALLNERQAPVDEGVRVLCPQCETVVPDMPFCPNCGVAAHASSHTLRTIRRTAADETVEVRRTSNTRILLAVAALTTVVAAAGVAAAVVVTPEPPEYVCPPDCGRPPIAEPIESNPRFVSPDGAFSVQYPGPGTAYKATLNPDGVDLEYVGGDTGTMSLFGLPAEGRTPKEITESLIQGKYPFAKIDYEIPNAMVGYELGYGVVMNEYPQDARGAFSRLRLVVLVAVRNDYALVAGAIGPFREFTRDDGPGHPSGANLQLAMDMGKYVNSFRWAEPAE
ncbi:zinc ribbon domain-containing protein [Mycobacterium sp. NPDC051804]|uniref:zinc ribbon domain-containing protein n=1 Tax=Mycobacterium sp. NPDC051804 TaxID=3364295 RepID=UPI0037915A8B